MGSTLALRVKAATRSISGLDLSRNNYLLSPTGVAIRACHEGLATCPSTHQQPLTY